MGSLTQKHIEKLTSLAGAMVDQNRARVIVPPTKSSEGFWFGSGSMIQASSGAIYLSGRYRNFGDSRTGLHLGERGVELAIFKSTDSGDTFDKIRSFSKEDLVCDGKTVLSIEGTYLHSTPAGVELFVSSEKSGIGYPPDLADYQKPGTGVWTIDVVDAESPESLDAGTIRPLSSGSDPRFLHVKDPVCYDTAAGDTVLVYCTHSFNWSSAHAGFIRRPAGADVWGPPNHSFFPRGFTWDVAASRITELTKVPAIGVFASSPPTTLVFYDGAESMRPYPQHAKAKSRPRGYSCEELGGLGFMVDESFDEIERLSVIEPLFVSPYGTRCSRYVRTLVDEQGIFTTWQQSQPDGSQPLVMNYLSMERVAEIIS